MFKVLEVIFELLTPFLMKNIIDKGIKIAMETGDYSEIFINGGIIIGFVILGFCSTLVCQYFSSIASQGFGTDLRNRIMKKINELSLKEINNYGTGYLTNLVNNDSNRLQLAVAMIIRLVIRAPALVIGSLVCSFIINYKIALIFVGIVIIVSIFMYFILRINSKKFVNLQKKNDKISQIVDDGLNGTRVIKSFNAENEEIEKYKLNTADYYKDAKTVSYLNALINPFTYLVINTGIILTIYIGNFEFINTNGAFTTGDIIALVSYLNQILTALIVVSNLVMIFNKAFASKKRVDSLLITETELKNDYKYESLSIKKGQEIISFIDVGFRYQNDGNDTIKSVDFNINKGETIGVIGGTGSGKSTIIKLIDRLFDATSGEVCYKGENIKDYDLNNLHKEISLVPQKNNLFKGTIRSNMLMANKTSTDEEIILALKKADAYSFVSKHKEFLDYPVEEGGRNFSGGQKQRLCIARALLTNSEVLILDDSTSALDFLTDKKVRKNIDEIKDLTKIYVSQRATSLSGCDKIIVVNNGTIESIGTHDELLKTSAVYKEIYESQVRSN